MVTPVCKLPGPEAQIFPYLAYNAAAPTVQAQWNTGFFPTAGPHVADGFVARGFTVSDYYPAEEYPRCQRNTIRSRLTADLNAHGFRGEFILDVRGRPYNEKEGTGVAQVSFHQVEQARRFKQLLDARQMRWTPTLVTTPAVTLVPGLTGGIPHSVRSQLKVYVISDVFQGLFLGQSTFVLLQLAQWLYAQANQVKESDSQAYHAYYEAACSLQIVEATCHKHPMRDVFEIQVLDAGYKQALLALHVPGCAAGDVVVPRENGQSVCFSFRASLAAIDGPYQLYMGPEKVIEYIVHTRRPAVTVLDVAKANAAVLLRDELRGLQAELEKALGITWDGEAHPPPLQQVATNEAGRAGPFVFTRFGIRITFPSKEAFWKCQAPRGVRLQTGTWISLSQARTRGVPMRQGNAPLYVHSGAGTLDSWMHGGGSVVAGQPVHASGKRGRVQALRPGTSGSGSTEFTMHTEDADGIMDQ